MPLIHVRCTCGTCQEWVLIELQGEIERSDGEALLDNLEVGTLCRAATVRRVCAPPHSLLRAGAASNQGVLKLTVGYHEVEGKLGALKKPLVVLRRVEGDGAGEPAYEAVGVIRKKYHFKNRPKALISAAEPGKRAKSSTRDAAQALFGKAAQ